VSRDRASSTRHLLELCAGYFVFYIATGVLVKYFTEVRRPPMSELAYLVSNTLGGSLVALGVVLVLGWWRMRSNRTVRVGPLEVPSEAAYIVPSGVCTAVVIPTTTLMYSLPISVMVAMVIMRGSIIVISRIVDAVQIRQGILRRRVYAQENWAVVFALLAVATNVVLLPAVGWLEGRGVRVAEPLGLARALEDDPFQFLHSPAALTIMALYATAYAVRIYLMNYFKNTRAPGVELDNKGFFAVEQIAASVTMAVALAFFALAPARLGWRHPDLDALAGALRAPDPWALLSGVPFGIVAFFSVFIFMFKGRTATFAGLVNRLTSLLAGTAATLLMAGVFGSRFPSAQDWLSVGFILIAVGFLTVAERKRVEELRAAG